MWASAENAEAEAAAQQTNFESGPFSNANLYSIYEQLDIENAGIQYLNAKVWHLNAVVTEFMKLTPGVHLIKVKCQNLGI